MNKIKSVFLSVFIIVFLFQGVGCMNFKNIDKPKETSETLDITTIKTMVLDHLQKKYDGVFEIVGESEPTLLNNEYEFTVVRKGKSYKNEGFEAFYLIKEKEYRDNYWGIIARDKIDDLVRPNTSSQCRFFSEPDASYYDESLNKKSKLEDATPFSINLYVFSDKQEDLQKIKRKLTAKGIDGILLFYLLDSDLLGELNYSNYSETISRIVVGKIKAKEQTIYLD